MSGQEAVARSGHAWLRQHPDLTATLVTVAIMLAAFVLLGQLVRERREHVAAAEARAAAAERGQQAEAARQVTEERMRIARDLHDVLAHHIALVNAQAGVAQYLLHTDPVAADRALAGIADHSQAALADLRAALGLLRGGPECAPEDRAPIPTAHDLDDLFWRSSLAGMRLSVQTIGEPVELPPALDTALYRIVQETLTNASKHAPGSFVWVETTWCGSSVSVRVVTGAPHGPGRDEPREGTGYGLAGMRERAASVGGRFEAGPTKAGGFLTSVTLPIPGAR